MPAKRRSHLPVRRESMRGRDKSILNRLPKRLYDVQRIEYLETRDDLMDETWVPSFELENECLRTRQRNINTRLSSNRRFFNAANQLHVLSPIHPLYKEAEQFYDFVQRVRQYAEKLTVIENNHSTTYYETTNAIWLPSMLRFKDQAAKKRTAQREEINQDHWTENCGTIKSVSKSMTYILSRQQTKPVCVMIGTRLMHKDYGHSIVLAIIKTATGLQAIVKDSLSITETNLKSLCRALLKRLKIDTVLVVGAFDFEDNVANSDCIRESYKVVGSILDGEMFFNRNLNGFTKTYNVKAWKQIN